MTQLIKNITAREITEYDVLLGRGGSNHTFVGNERLRELAWIRRDKYISLNKKKKTEMSRELVRYIREELGGRFLRPDPNSSTWEDVGDSDIAREKVSQCLRDAVSDKNPPKSSKRFDGPECFDEKCAPVFTSLKDEDALYPMKDISLDRRNHLHSRCRKSGNDYIPLREQEAGQIRFHKADTLVGPHPKNASPSKASPPRIATTPYPDISPRSTDSYDSPGKRKRPEPMEGIQRYNSPPPYSYPYPYSTTSYGSPGKRKHTEPMEGYQRYSSPPQSMYFPNRSYAATYHNSLGVGYANQSVNTLSPMFSQIPTPALGHSRYHASNCPCRVCAQRSSGGPNTGESYDQRALPNEYSQAIQLHPLSSAVNHPYFRPIENNLRIYGEVAVTSRVAPAYQARRRPLGYPNDPSDFRQHEQPEYQWDSRYEQSEETQRRQTEDIVNAAERNEMRNAFIAVGQYHETSASEPRDELISGIDGDDISLVSISDSREMLRSVRDLEEFDLLPNGDDASL